jgi:nitroreductase
MLMTPRSPAHSILPIFAERWSPRAFDGSSMRLADLMTIFEAARWAPSAFNIQPWRFLYSLRGDTNWENFLSLLIPWNESWAKTASALIFVLSDTLTRTKAGDLEPSHSHSFDAGAAWAHIALQAHALGYHSHVMTGIRQDAARAGLAVPDRYRIEAAIAIGRIADPDTLDPALRDREKPSDRKPIESFAHAGNFQS